MDHISSTHTKGKDGQREYRKWGQDIKPQSLLLGVYFLQKDSDFLWVTIAISKNTTNTHVQIHKPRGWGVHLIQPPPSPILPHPNTQRKRGEHEKLYHLIKKKNRLKACKNNQYRHCKRIKESIQKDNSNNC